MDTTSGLGRLVQELDAAVSAEARKTAEAAAADAPAEQGDKGDKGKAENGKPAASISYRFILTDKQWDKMRNGTIEEPFGYKVRIE